MEQIGTVEEYSAAYQYQVAAINGLQSGDLSWF